MSELRPIAIGDGDTLIDIPATFTTEFEKNDMVCATLPDCPDLLSLRFTVLSFHAKKAGKTAEIDAATRTFICNQGDQKEVHESAGKVWYFEDSESEEEGEQTWLRFWHIAFHNKVVVISFCCSRIAKQEPLVLRTVAVVPKLIETLRIRGEHSPPTLEETDNLESERALIANILRQHYDAYSLPRIAADLAGLQRLINDRIFTPEQEYEWRCVGTVYGDVLANELGLHWVTHYSEEYGAESALNLLDTSLTVFPRTMILKRVEKGDAVILDDLLASLRDTIEELRERGY